MALRGELTGGGVIRFFSSAASPVSRSLSKRVGQDLTLLHLFPGLEHIVDPVLHVEGLLRNLIVLAVRREFT